MAEIHGMPMIGHVYHRCKICPEVDEVIVATCDLEILDYITSQGGKAVMTGSHHERCTDRVVEALEVLHAENGFDPEVVVLVQGDEPMVVPDMISEALSPFSTDSNIKVVNLMGELQSRDEHDDPNEVKVVVDLKDRALYFSREPIPSHKKAGDVPVPMYKQVCIIPFRKDFLLEYSRLEPTPLEKVESVDMMRILEHGHTVQMVRTNHSSYAVDTPKDLAMVIEATKDDPFMPQYLKRSKS